MDALVWRKKARWKSGTGIGEGNGSSSVVWPWILIRKRLFSLTRVVREIFVKRDA